MNKPQIILSNINSLLSTLVPNGYSWERKVRIDDVYDELGIFDWWREYLSISQLKQMKKFLETAIRMGYTGYACFKVGAVGCANGMWAHKDESTTGYSPDGEAIYHSFVCDENYWGVSFGDNKWENRSDGNYRMSLADVKSAIANHAVA